MFRLEPLCSKTGKPTGYLTEKKCFQPIETMTEEENPQTKVCKECGRELSVEQFGRHAKTKDGLQPLCKDCRSAKVKKAKPALEGVGTPLDPVTGEARKEPLPEQIYLPPDLEGIPDDDLTYELARRGWRGTLTKTITVEFNITPDGIDIR